MGWLKVLRAAVSRREARAGAVLIEAIAAGLAGYAKGAAPIKRQHAEFVRRATSRKSKV